ncbi:MAG TPA: hypothetical protein VD794_14220, partial [Flavisolibacter sp.]|nr:hypothetical protein [Flavisolibacter sp.]
VYLVQLSGHYEEGVNIRQVTTALWQNEMFSGYTIAKQAAINYGLPLYFLGYSLGALLGQTMIALIQEKASFDKQILLAPAVAIRKRSHWLRILFFFNKQTLLPSFTPKDYRANKALPLHIYQILFNEEKKLWAAKEHHLNIPTLILIDPKDELISYSRLLQWINQFKLSHYRVIVLKEDLKNRKSQYHHLIISEETMGSVNWDIATNAIKQFLFK